MKVGLLLLPILARRTTVTVAPQGLVEQNLRTEGGVKNRNNGCGHCDGHGNSYTRRACFIQCNNQLVAAASKMLSDEKRVATEAMAKDTNDFNKVDAQTKSDINDSEQTLEQTAAAYDVQSLYLQGEVTKASDAIEVKIPPIEREAAAKEKEAEKSLESQTTLAEKAFEYLEEKAEKANQAAADKTESMLEADEKETERAEKQDDKDLSRMESEDEKKLAGWEKKAEKEQETAAAETEKTDEAITEEEDASVELASKLTEVADSADAAMETSASAQEYAQEGYEALKDKYDNDLGNKLEAVEAEGTSAAADVSKTLQDSLKDSGATVADAEATTSESLEELKKTSEQMLDEQESSLTDHEKTLLAAQKDQEEEAKKLDESLAKTQGIEQSNSDRASELLAGLKEQITEMITKNKDLAQMEIAEHGETLTTDVAKRKAAGLRQIEKGANQILADADAATSQIQEQFAGNYEGMASKLGKTLRDLDFTKTGVYQDQKTTEQGLEAVANLEGTAAAELTGFAQKAIQAKDQIEDQSAQDQEVTLNTLSTSLASATEQVKEDANTARQSVTENYNALAAETDTQEEAINNKIAEMAAQYNGIMKEVDGVLKPAEEQQNAAESQLGQVNEDLNTINEDTQKMKETYGAQLMSVQDRIMQAAEKFQEDQQKTFQGDEEYAQAHLTQLEQALGQILDQQQSNFEQQAAGVGTTVKTVEESEAARRKAETETMNGLDHELNTENKKIQDQEAKFLPEYKTMMESVQAAAAKIDAIQSVAEASREGLEDHMKDQTKAKVAALQAEVLKLLDDGAKQTSAQTKELDENLRQQVAQSDTETQNAMKNIDGSLKTTVEEYKEIVNKVQKLEEHSKDLTGDAWLQRAADAVALLEKDQMDRTTAIQKLNSGYQEGAQKADAEIDTFEQDQTNAREQFTQELIAAIAAIEQQRAEAKATLDSKMLSMDNEQRLAAGQIESDQQAMREAIANGEDAVLNAEQAGMQNIGGLERRVDGKAQDEMRRLQEMSLDSARKRAHEQAEQAGVNRDLTAEQRAVGTEVGAMQNAVAGMLNNLDPNAQLGVVGQSLDALQKLNEHAEETERLKVSQVEGDVRATGDKIAQILAAAGAEGGMLSKAVMQTAMEARDKIATLKTKLLTEQEGIRNLAKDTFQTAKDLKAAHHRHVTGVQQTVDGMQEQLRKALGLQKYQSGEALEKVLFILDKAIGIDEGLIREKDSVIVPETTTWRGQVERVFEGMNMALDLEKVERMARMSAAAEQADGNGMLSAKEKLDKEIAMIQNKMQTEIDFVRNKAQRMIAEIEADASLSAAQKAAMIKAIKKKADADVYKLTMRTQKLISDQYMSGHKLDEEIHNLQNLLERAKNIAGQGTAESAAWAKAMMEEVKKRISTLRERYVNTYSFLQMDQMVQDAEAAVSEAARGSPRPVDPLVARHAAFVQADEDLAANARKRESQDAAWGNALDALDMGITLLQQRKAK